jgi:hypothetical protein
MLAGGSTVEQIGQRGIDDRTIRRALDVWRREPRRCVSSRRDAGLEVERVNVIANGFGERGGCRLLRVGSIRPAGQD